MMDDGSAVEGNMIKPELFQFIVDSEMIYWSAKGCFSVGKVPIKELGAGMGDKPRFVISPGKDVFLKSC